jgi:adenosylcobinamide-phosphate synthase
MDWTTAFLVLALASLFEIVAGYPPWLFAAIGHPTTWIGGLVALLERRFNDATLAFEPRRFAGLLALFILLAVTGFVAEAVALLALALPLGLIVLALILSSFLAARSLDEHVEAVADGLDRGGLEAGRAAVARIVGRNPAALDRHGIARAAIESLAENFSDGVIAPGLWFVLLGLPGAVLYKAINTADSMIGHRDERHLAFGWGAARLDDLVNLPASRLSALLLVAAAVILPGADPAAAWRAVRRDATKHRSPNAGWPEAAMAGALGLRLAGPRVYGATMVVDAYMGGGRVEAEAADIRRALDLFRLASLIELILIAALAVAGYLTSPG